MTASGTNSLNDNTAVNVNSRDHLDGQQMKNLCNIHDNPDDSGAQAYMMNQSVKLQETAREYHKMDRGASHKDLKCNINDRMGAINPYLSADT